MTRPAHTRRLRRGLLLAALAAAALPIAPAHAQLGRLIKKAAQGAVEGAARGAARDAAPAATGAPAIAITSESIDQLLAALAPSVEAATAYEAARVRHETGTAKLEAHRTCRDSVKKAFGGVMAPSAASMDAQVEYGSKVSELMLRMNAAQQAGDAARSRALLDSVGVLGEAMENTMLPALRKCGAYVPAAPDSPRAPQVAPPKVPAGMTATQFGRLRERVAAWLLTDGAYTVGDDERGALDARRKDLAPLAPLFRGHALQWASWSDLSAR